MVPGAEVTLTNVDRGTHSNAKTGGGGRYLFRSLPPGDYSLQVQAPNFDTYAIPKIALDINAAVTGDASLRLSGSKSPTVIVEAQPSLLSENATISQTLPRQLINDLPLVNRNPFDLAFLAPGVSQTPGSTYGNGVSTPGFVTNFVSDGSRNAQADMLLDGVSVMNSDNNPGVQKALYVPPVEAIQEFTIQQANFSAEFGNSGGTIVNVVTRSGTNQYHGELFEFLRNNVLNANSFFANAAGLAQPHLTRNDFGVTAGGPIFKNKTFFFFDFNGIRALTGATSSEAGVPDAAERAAILASCAQRVGGTFDSSGICSNPAGQIYDPYTSKPDAENNATGRAPIPFDNLATYISPGNPSIPFGLGNLPSTPGQSDRSRRRQAHSSFSAPQSERRIVRLRSVSQLGDNGLQPIQPAIVRHQTGSTFQRQKHRERAVLA